MVAVTVVSLVVAVASTGVAGLGWWRFAAAHRRLAAAHHAATHDQLTGLANRTGLASAWGQLTGGPWAPAVLVIDLDDFKPINDTYGHAAGDRVLVDVASRLRAAVGSGGVVARLGGDEFAALVVHDDPARLAARLARAVAVPVTLSDGLSVAVSATIGVTVADGSDLASSLARADAAMYRAKSSGGRVAVYHPLLDDRTSLAREPRPVVRVRELDPGPAYVSRSYLAGAA